MAVGRQAVQGEALAARDHVATAGALWAGGALALLAVPLLRAGRGTRVRV
ncbi:hypothetical protein ACFUJU_29980 [Streptomyces sp. NPDC057235]